MTEAEPCESLVIMPGTWVSIPAVLLFFRCSQNVY